MDDYTDKGTKKGQTMGTTTGAQQWPPGTHLCYRKQQPQALLQATAHGVEMRSTRGRDNMDHHHDSTPNCCCKQLLAGLKQGATGTGMTGRRQQQGNQKENGPRDINNISWVVGKFFPLLFSFHCLVTNKL
jgi:hypothetical protein